MASHSGQQTTDTDPQPPQGALLYVLLPRHPLFGRQVRLLSRRPTSTKVICVVATPQQPAFRYRLPERWLASTPPAPPSPLPAAPLCLPLAALDTLTQRLLGLQRAERSDV